VYPEAARHLAGLAWGQLLGAKSRFCSDRIGELLTPVIDPDVVAHWLGQVDSTQVERVDRQPVESVQQFFDDAHRRQDGVYLTPPALADALAAGIEPSVGDVVIDLSAGAASLLGAAIRRHPGMRAIGVEKNPLLAIAAAIQLVAYRASQRAGQLAGQRDGDRIYVGDGLAVDDRWAEFEGEAAAVIGNPPYVREKGNRALFQQLRAGHPHLEQYFGPRMDLQYLFFHRGASFVRPGGKMIMLTTAYWMSATNADKVRADMAERLRPELLIGLQKAGAFADAPGQHSLISMFRRPMFRKPMFRRAMEPSAVTQTRALSLSEQPDDWTELVDDLLADSCSRRDVRVQESDEFSARIWSPFAAAEHVSWGRRLRTEATPLSELLSDRQGFVSGADRFSSRHSKYYEPGALLPRTGEPIFIFERDEVPEHLAHLEPTMLRPLLRASELEPNTIVVTPPRSTFALYIDGPLEADTRQAIERHLDWFRPVLERRREVRRGSMPWYRLHWPRDRAEQTGPKLVVPRRAPSPCFGLDLSASAVSSDCTYLVAPDDIDDPLGYLVTLMVVLNSEPTARYLRHFGKAKGKQLEFYSEPLRSLPLPVRRGEDGLVWIDGLVDASVRKRCDRLVEELLEAACG
jgi:adenine-specific DNA-methyltransferase